MPECFKPYSWHGSSLMASEVFTLHRLGPCRRAAGRRPCYGNKSSDNNHRRSRASHAVWSISSETLGGKTSPRRHEARVGESAGPREDVGGSPSSAEPHQEKRNGTHRVPPPQEAWGAPCPRPALGDADLGLQLGPWGGAATASISRGDPRKRSSGGHVGSVFGFLPKTRRVKVTSRRRSSFSPPQAGAEFPN